MLSEIEAGDKANAGSYLADFYSGQPGIVTIDGWILIEYVSSHVVIRVFE